MSPTRTDSAVDAFDLLDDEASYDHYDVISYESLGEGLGGEAEAIDHHTEASHNTRAANHTTEARGASDSDSDSETFLDAAPRDGDPVRDVAAGPFDIPPAGETVILTADPAPTPARKRRMRKPILIAVAVIVAMLATAAGTLVAMAKTVTISVDGATQQVTTLSSTVDGALSSAGLSVGPHDTLAPAGGTEISGGSEIAIQRGRLFTLDVDGTQRKVWTTATTVEAAMAQLGRRAADFQLSASRSREIPLSGMSVTANSLHTVTLVTTPAPSVAEPAAKMTTLAASASGAPEELTTAAKTVGDLLAQQGIVVGAADRVSPGVDTPLADGLAITMTTLPTVSLQVGTATVQTVISDATTVAGLLSAQGVTLGKDDSVAPGPARPVTDGMDIMVNRVSFTTTTKKVAIPQPADKKVSDSSLAKGKTQVTQAGHAGTTEITYRAKVVNGKAGSPAQVSSKTVTDAVPTVIHVGTYVAPPAPKPASSSSSGGSGSGGSSSVVPSTSGGPGVAVWEKIAQCESGNRWNINTGNGYYGGLQFDRSTWLANGGGQYAARADLATKAQQIAIANNVYAHRGLRPWSCARIVGLI